MLSEELGLQKLLKGREGRPCSGSADSRLECLDKIIVFQVIMELRCHFPRTFDMNSRLERFIGHQDRIQAFDMNSRLERLNEVIRIQSRLYQCCSDDGNL